MHDELKCLPASELGFPRSQRVFTLKGTLPPEPRLAVVGSRAAFRSDRPGVDLVVERAGALGFSFVSGGALGVDAWMHESALDQGHPQLAVLPCAPSGCYPPAHYALFRAIAAAKGSGLLYSLPKGQSPVREAFVARNEIVVRAAQAVVVVQCQPRSGSMWTARRALACKRPVAVFEGSPGAAWLLSQGARNLGKVGEAGQARRIAAWLRSEPCPVRAHWPVHLGALRRRLTATADTGLGVDDFQDPLKAAIELGEALALGLVVETCPGRYVVAR